MINKYISDNEWTVLYVRDKITEDGIVSYICDYDYCWMSHKFSESFLKQEFQGATFVERLFFKLFRIISFPFPYKK